MAANQRKTHGRRREDQPLYRILAPALMGLGLVGLLVFAYQGYVSYRDQQQRAHLEETADWAVEVLATSIATQREVLENAAQSPAVRDALTSPGNAGQPGNIAEQLPAAGARVFFHPANPDERQVAPWPGLDYAALDLMWDFMEGGQPIPAEVHLPDQPTAHLVLLAPVLSADGEALLGFIRAVWPAGSWYSKLAAADVGQAYFALRQGEAGWNNTELFALGESDTPVIEDSTAVPGSRLRISYGAAPGFALLATRSNAVILAGLIASLLLLTGAIWLRRQARRSPEMRQPGPADSSPDSAVESGVAPAPTPAPAALETKQAPVEVSAGMFRAYDIRGVVGKTLDAAVTRRIGQAIGSEAKARGITEIAIARDGRLSGPELSRALSEGLRWTGCDVIDIGMAPTPVLYFATHHLHTGSGVMLTGSHNPPDYNGFKIVLGGETLAEDAIQDLYRRIVEERFEHGQGALREEDINQAYIDRISSDVQLQGSIKVVADAGNGVAGAIAQPLLEAIGAEVIPLYCEVDGTFPNHHPDPSVPENLKDLTERVQSEGADLGLAFDGDGDRLGVVTPSGQNIYPDRILLLFARDVLTRNPGAAIIFDVKCSAHLHDKIVEWGGSPIMWKTGHSLIKAKLKETGALLAGEMSGHFFFTERWYGFDDGLYAACRLLEILSQESDAPGDILERLPAGESTPELRIEMAEGENFAFFDRFKEQARFDDARIVTIDGLRADFPDGWGLVRCSNTTPCLVLRFEGQDEAALERVQSAFREQLKALDANLKLPF